MSKVKNSTIETLPLLELKNVKKNYIKGDHIVEAIRNISIKIYPEEFIAILGPSGSGKSTLLSLIAGLERPTDGEISINNESITHLSEDERTILRRHTIGIIFQFFNLQDILTALENVEFPLFVCGEEPTARRDLASSLLTTVGLDNLDHRLPHELSGGEKQRVGIARALVNKPPLLLADEPTGDLDSQTSEEIIDLLVSLPSTLSTTIIMVTHDEEALRSGMRVLLLSDGQIEEDFMYEGDHKQITERLEQL